jgi:hypothetical protein
MRLPPPPAGGRCFLILKQLSPSCGGGPAALSWGGGEQPARMSPCQDYNNIKVKEVSLKPGV